MNNQKLEEISELINTGNYKLAYDISVKLLIEVLEVKDFKIVPIFIFNIAGFFIDIGDLWQKKEICQKGLDLLLKYEKSIMLSVPRSQYYYNLANAKSYMIAINSGSELDFINIEEVIELKNIYWKAFKENQIEDKYNPQLLVNLANTLKRQYRVSESLRYYDNVLENNKDIFQAHFNRSETLMRLNEISHSYSGVMIRNVIKGFTEVLKSQKAPRQIIEYSKRQKIANTSIYDSLQLDCMPELDDIETDAEYNDLSDYRKYCLENKLTLSEHGLYCSCSVSARDNLTIPLTSTPVGGNFVPHMEAILNRLKSEFSLARKNLYDYFNNVEKRESIYEDCYTELFNNEILGVEIEKLRSAFRICFGILDKIALGICNLYEIRSNDKIYFQSFWRLDQNNNRSKFNLIKNPGLLALYSIASDLNNHKRGEWSHFKEWRNALEHGMFIILSKEDEFADPYNSLKIGDNIVKVSVEDFIVFLEELLQLTRSAIFSFVFCVRAHAFKQNEKGLTITLDRKSD